MCDDASEGPYESWVCASVLYGESECGSSQSGPPRPIRKEPDARVAAGHGMVDHVHRCLSSPPKNSVPPAVGRRKGKLAIRIHREVLVHEAMSCGSWFSG